MRSSLAVVLGLSLSSFALACTAPLPEGDSASVNAADTTRSFPQLCLVPKGHPVNGDGPIFTLDAEVLGRAIASYWHYVPVKLGGEDGQSARPSESWSVDSSTVTGAPVHFEGHELIPQLDRAKSFGLDLVPVVPADPSKPWWGRGVTGTLKVHDVAHPNQADEVVEIVDSYECRNL